ncbi:lipase, putative [Talaromyces stipitatus ATCC 10500]|uniref:Lipase, putative n=1 Tax=Talaromyces stipitatus (strain ATCC 10500 / CBS 375.48 / QM 6759 / NRRL 1006) TaxID=441959 RepID=B8MFQ9_TALSN|nr:lipase, putative [Talaromyces stipitatus ATCC 10500]EED17049.1 lipase, putative [Talaromyces stipitatus ATCC 10500]
MQKTPLTTELDILMGETTEDENESISKNHPNNANNSTSDLHLSHLPTTTPDSIHRVGTVIPTTKPHNRSWLHVQATVWRFLMSIGMFLHTVGWSRPPRPSFVRRIPFSTRGRTVDLYFYCPASYWQHKKNNRRLSSQVSQHRPYPVVVNFHGGGFTLGRATDDSFWAKCILKETDAVFVSVEYRLAPEHPFPAAVDDGVEALLYLAAHAGELGIDASRIVLTGFSSGANLAITVPLRLQQRIKNEAGSDIINIEPFESTQHLVGNQGNLQIVATFAWYPLLDFVASRAHRRAMSVIPGKTMPSFFTTLFDESYLPNHAERFSPFASPERAPDEMLSEGLPHDIFLYTCEWDMLLQEGQRFVRRLEDMGKKVRAMMVEKVPHAWDKSPNPFRDQEQINVFYKAAWAFAFV